MIVIVPLAVIVSHPPVRGIEKLNVPAAVGVPDTVIILLNHEAVTPLGNPEGVPIPVAPVVVKVTLGIAVPMQTVGVLDAVDTVFVGLTVMVPNAFIGAQPPVTGME